MIKYILVIVVMCRAVCVCGQDYGEKIDPNDGFSDRLKRASASIESISCDFDQIKQMAVLTKPVRSKGRFYYQQEQKMCLEYSLPQGNLIVMCDGRFKIVNNGVTTIVSNKVNPMMRQMTEMLTACMTGNISLFGSKEVPEYYESSELYTVIITFRNKRVQNYMKRIVLCFDKQDMTLSSMRMCETDADYTHYDFKDKKLNGIISEDKFKI